MKGLVSIFDIRPHIDSNGRIVGFDSVTDSDTVQLPESTYSGSESEPEIAIIFSPVPGRYLLKLVGTGNGPFTLDICYAGIENPITQTYTGTITLGKVIDLNMEISATTITDVKDQFMLQMDTTPPVTTDSLKQTPNANGWNNTNVTVNLTATDNTDGSGVKEIHYAINSGPKTVVPGDSALFIITNRGENLVTYFAIDNAGNIETLKSLTVNICDYSFEDSTRGTKLYVVENDRTFQFIAPDKEFPIKKATRMKIIDFSKEKEPPVKYDSHNKKWNLDSKKLDLDDDLRPFAEQHQFIQRPDKIILINHKDSDLQLSAVIVDGKEDSCVAIARDLKTKKVYLLIVKPELKKPKLWKWDWNRK
jgi:hypothetical protein